MSKPVFYIVLLLTLFAFRFGFAQTNLVYNGGFEEYTMCPESNELNNGQFERCKGWYRPSLATSDYFNDCNTADVGIPNNFWGHQESYEGQGYVGFVPAAWNISTSQYDDYGFEYIQTKLIHPLTPCVEYHFEMYLNFADNSLYAYSRIGALFTNQKPYVNVGPILFTPQVLNSQGILADTVNWVKVEGNFVSTGNEEYLTIGYFFDNVQNDTLNFQDPQVPLDITGGYYYVDNVSLFEIGTVSDCSYVPPNIFSPNGDGDNDVWGFGGSSEGELTIVNRWGNPVFQSKGYSFSWDGGNCSDGVYYFTYISDNFSKTGFIQLIRSQYH